MAFKKTVLLLICLVTATVVARALLRKGSQSSPMGRRVPPTEILANYDNEKLDSEIRYFCSRCHGFPEPTLLPDHRWPHEIDRALDFFAASGEDWKHPDERVIVAWFQVNASSKLPLKTPIAVDPDAPFREPTSGPTLKSFAGVSNIFVGEAPQETGILTTDMLSGDIRRTSLDGSKSDVLYRANNPSRIRPCRLDDSGAEQYLIADLGTATVTDDLVGQVVWLKQSSEGSAFEAQVIATDLGRVADAQSCDFDSDGDQDVLIAEFGWDRTGSIVLLENTGGAFERKVIDDRHGTVEFKIVDLDKDGALDFVAILGQEFETVELFRNVGGLKFETNQLYRAPNPTYGVSSLNVLDNDNDGDLDIFFTSGDMYDSMFIQDHHGVYLLTNVGDGDFKVATVGLLPGAMAAEVGDVDGDGDLDVVASSFIPDVSSYARSEGYAGLVLFEQTGKNTYKRRALRAGKCCTLTLRLADLDKDDDLDVITGVLHDAGGPPEPGIEIWSNQSRK